VRTLDVRQAEPDRRTGAVRPLRAVALGLLALLPALLVAEDRGYQRMTTSDGTRLDYRLLAPDEAQESYRVLLALPPGPQTVGMVDWGIRSYYLDEAQRRGWVVVSPVAPGGLTFVQGAERYLPELLEETGRSYPPEGGKFHLAGVSNGGLSSFRIAGLHPELFHSIAVLPGWPSPQRLDELDRLAGIPLRMWAGERENPVWLELMRKAESRLRELDADVELHVLPSEGHTLGSLMGGKELFDFLESVRPEAAGVNGSTP